MSSCRKTERIREGMRPAEEYLFVGGRRVFTEALSQRAGGE